MIVDIDQAVPLPLAARYDICIAGGGVAGIVLAYTLAGRGKRILLLEAGGYEFSENSQSLYSGANIGREYFDLDVTRLRYLGGTSNHWAGVCRPLDVHDFKRRDHIDGSGWPIGITDIQPYLSEAREIMEISDFPAEPALNGTGGRLKEIAFRQGGRSASYPAQHRHRRRRQRLRRRSLERPDSGLRHIGQLPADVQRRHPDQAGLQGRQRLDSDGPQQRGRQRLTELALHPTRKRRHLRGREHIPRADHQGDTPGRGARGHRQRGAPAR